jgi:hypothetical protein
MAANFYFVLVKAKEETDISKLLENVGFEGFSPVKKVDIWETSKPDTLFVGYCNGYLIFANDDLAIQFSNDEPTDIEKAFIQHFPDTEIVALVMNESVGFFVFSIIENGVRKRLKHGSDGEIYGNFGEQLPEELEILTTEIFDPEELEEMEENGEDIEALIEFEASYRVPHLIMKNRLGIDFMTSKDGEITLVRYE